MPRRRPCREYSVWTSPRARTGPPGSPFGAASSPGDCPVCSSVCSNDHAGLRDAIAATLPGASWQRCRTHYLRNLLTKVPRAAEAMMDHQGPHHLRPTRPRIRPRRSTVEWSTISRVSVWTPAADHLDQGRRPNTRLHRVPQSELAADLVQQPPRTAEQRNTAPDQRRRGLPHPSLDHPPRQRPVGRTT